MYYVYIIKSQEKFLYIGLTDNLKGRLHKHNSEKSKYTKRGKNWKLITYIAFQARPKAAAFEKYLKTGSGKAWLKKRLL